MNALATQPRYSLKPGWICIATGSTAIVVFGPLGAMICGPLMIVSMILTVIGMAKNNTGGGIALFIAALVLPSLAFVVWIVLLAVLKSGDTTALRVPGESISLEPLHWLSRGQSA
jgi:hypothetical protein